MGRNAKGVEAEVIVAPNHWVRGLLFVLSLFVLTGAVALSGSWAKAETPIADTAISETSIKDLARLFGALPRLVNPDLSPDGTHIAALEPVDGRFALVVRAVAVPEKTIVAFRDRDANIDGFRWATATRLLVTESFPGVRLGIPTIETRLIGVNSDGTHRASLPEQHGRWTPQIGTDIVAAPASDPIHILMNVDREKGRGTSVYRVDIENGQADLVEPGTGLTVGWLADAAGVIRARFDDDGPWRETWVRSNANEPWRLMRRDKNYEGPDFIPLAFSPENLDRMIVASNAQTGRLAIYPFDTVKGTFGPVMFERPDVDVDGLIKDKMSGEVVGFSYVGDLPVKEFAAANLTAFQSKIHGAVPGRTSRVVSVARGAGVSIILSQASARPASYALRESAHGTLTQLGAQYPALEGKGLASVVPWSYRARDGLMIPAYVTLPPGAQLDGGGRTWPVVVMPHGGPTSRDSIGFDFLAQFLAAQGYVVLKPNFRGSSGYGLNFEQAGQGEWGRSMQDDVTDGAKALIALGLADPRHIAIVGGSYGGYAALMGIAREPGLFRAGVSISGVADLGLFMHRLSFFRGAAERKPLIVNPPDDPAVIATRSPVALAARIEVPVLLIHGKKDHVVSVEHAKAMAAALRRAGKLVELVLLPNSDHSFSVEPERIEMLEKLGTFLAQAMN